MAIEIVNLLPEAKPEEMPMPSRLSYSAMSTYIECGERYRLEKVYKVEQKYTWLATVAGSVLHDMTEEIDRMVHIGSDFDFARMIVDDFDVRLAKAIAKEEEKGLEVKVSGNIRKVMSEEGGPDKKDVVWWNHFGPICLDKWVAWRKETGYEIAVLGNEPAIELKFQIMAGKTPVTGCIDRVFKDQAGNLIVVDLKFGSRPQTSSIQPVTYALGLSGTYGVDPKYVTFWRPWEKTEDKKPSPSGGTTPYLTVTGERMAYAGHLFEMADRGIANGIYMPDPDSCGICPVADFCRLHDAKLSASIPISTKMLERGLDKS